MNRESATDRKRRPRMAVAAAISLALHLLIWLFAQPAYREVRDIAVSMEILESETGQMAAPEAAGPRDAEPTEPVVAQAPEPPAGQIVNEPPPESRTEKAQDPAAPPSAADTAESTDPAEKSTDPSDADTGATQGSDSSTDKNSDSDTNSDTDTGTTAVEDTALARAEPAQDSDAMTGTDETTVAGAAESRGAGGDSTDTDTAPGGICLHDVFAWSNGNPTWMLWLAMDAFAGTAYADGLAGTLGSFYLYNEMARATGIKPLTELESVLISADSFSDFSTYQVVTTFNVTQEVLVDRLKRNHTGDKRFTLKKTPQGVSGIFPGRYRWDFVGSGRVMVASDAAKGRFNRNWPAAVSCMAPRPPFVGDGHKNFARLVRAQIGPSAEGRWPVLMIATRDPDALGLRGQPAMAEAFQWAWVKGYFSDPPRLEGVVQFSPAMKDMETVRRMVTVILNQKSVARMVGLGEIPARVQWEIRDNRLEFAIPLTESEVRLIFMLLRSYSARLNRMFARDAAPGSP